MGISKVEFGGETLVDLTGDTVTPQSLLSGYSAHNRAGELIEGLLTIPTVGNGTVTIKQNGVSKGTFTMNQSGNTTIELTDNNTTYNPATQSANGLMTAADKKKLDGLTTTTSLAVTQQGTSVLDGTVGKILNDKGAQISVYKGADGNLHFRDWTGADTVVPFSGASNYKITFVIRYNIYISNNLDTLSSGNKTIVIKFIDDKIYCDTTSFSAQSGQKPYNQIFGSLVSAQAEIFIESFSVEFI